VVTSYVVLSHPHDEVKGCHKGANGTRITSEHDIVETTIVVGCAWQGIKDDCGKINMGIIRASRGLPFGSTRHFQSL
jgi:hypothetical protein